MNREEFKNLLQQQAQQVTKASSAKPQPKEEIPRGCSMCRYTGFVSTQQECNSGIGWFDNLFKYTHCPYCNAKK